MERWKFTGLELDRNPALPERSRQYYDGYTISADSLIDALRERRLFALRGFGVAAEGFLIDFVNDTFSLEDPLEKTDKKVAIAASAAYEEMFGAD